MPPTRNRLLLQTHQNSRVHRGSPPRVVSTRLLPLGLRATHLPALPVPVLRVPAPLPVAEHTHVVAAESDGYIARLDAMAVGVAAWRLGAGRARKEDDVQAVAGVEMHAKPGDHITRGAPLFTLHTATPERFERALEALDGAVTCSGSPVTPDPVILGRIDAGT